MKNYRIRKVTIIDGQGKDEVFFVEIRKWRRFLLIPVIWYWDEYLCEIIQPFKTLEGAKQVYDRIGLFEKEEIIESK